MIIGDKKANLMCKKKKIHSKLNNKFQDIYTTQRTDIARPLAKTETWQQCKLHLA